MNRRRQPGISGVIFALSWRIYRSIDAFRPQFQPKSALNPAIIFAKLAVALNLPGPAQLFTFILTMFYNYLFLLIVLY